MNNINISYNPDYRGREAVFVSIDGHKDLPHNVTMAIFEKYRHFLKEEEMPGIYTQNAEFKEDISVFKVIPPSFVVLHGYKAHEGIVNADFKRVLTFPFSRNTDYYVFQINGIKGNPFKWSLKACKNSATVIPCNEKKEVTEVLTGGKLNGNTLVDVSNKARVVGPGGCNIKQLSDFLGFRINLK